MTRKVTAYSCGSPIRLSVINAIAMGAAADHVVSNPDPQYIRGDSIIWGLIRGASRLMLETRENGFDFYQVDNAYFGRDQFFRVTKNATQLRHLPNRVLSNRYRETLAHLGKEILPWRRTRSGPIVLCPSSEFLHRGTPDGSVQGWVQAVYKQIRLVTDREVVVRIKALRPADDIDEFIRDAWCVVTHVSAAGLDALRLGVPVVTTGDCAATPLSTPISQIEKPLMEDGREALFSLLGCGQFTLQEMRSTNIPKAIDALLSQI